MAAPIRGAGAVVEVQGVTVGHGTGVGEAEGLAVTTMGVSDGLDDVEADGDGDRDGDSEATDGCGVGDPRP
jgi:hypothetical protein